MPPKFSQKLAERKSQNEFRKLVNTDGLIDFISNDYLGLARLDFSTEAIKKSGTGSRLISGNSYEAIETERFLAETFEAEKALVFNSGYDTNLGFFSAVPQRGELILYDELIHASVRDGIRLSLAESFSFSHNSLEDLEKKLIRFADKTVFIAIESYYSMDGDFAPIEAILNLAKRYDAYVVVDEAHATGVFGERGLGLTYTYRNHSALFARIITFGKAFGAHGGAVLGSSELIDYLINFARSFIYTTALPPEAYSRIKNAVLYSTFHDELRVKLYENIAIWNSIFPGQEGPIQIVPCSDLNLLQQCVSDVRNKGWALKGVWSPTVPQGQERLRVCIHANHSPEEITALGEFLQSKFRS